MSLTYIGVEDVNNVLNNLISTISTDQFRILYQTVQSIPKTTYSPGISVYNYNTLTNGVQNAVGPRGLTNVTNQTFKQSTFPYAGTFFQEPVMTQYTFLQTLFQSGLNSISANALATCVGQNQLSRINNTNYIILDTIVQCIQQISNAFILSSQVQQQLVKLFATASTFIIEKNKYNQNIIPQYISVYAINNALHYYTNTQQDTIKQALDSLPIYTIDGLQYRDYNQMKTALRQVADSNRFLQLGVLYMKELRSEIYVGP